MQFPLKHIFLILTFLCFDIQQLVVAQDLNLDQIISVNYKAAPLVQVIEDIHSKCQIEFSYSQQIIPSDFLITYSATKKVKNILDDILATAGVEYDVVGNYLVLKKSVDDIKPTAIKRPQRFTFSGTITDNETKEVLIGAAIYNKATGMGTLSNNYGFYSLSLPPNNYVIEISYLGYKKASYEINLTQDIVNDIGLLPNPSMMEEIVVTSEDKEKLVFTSLAGQMSLRPKEVYSQNAVMGETDMLKSLDNLPGISFHNDGSSYFYVRGGFRDQNLILLDEATIYNPSHLLGLFTPIIPEAVKYTKIYKADFPIQYGGRLSSVIDIRTKDGNMEKFSGNGNIGLISTRLSLEGPLKKNTSSYFLSFRRSHLGAFFKKLNPVIDEFYFKDFNAKFNIKLGQKDRLFLTLYSGKDSFLMQENETKSGLQWGNNSLTLRWNHVFGHQLFLNTTFYSSKYDYFLYKNYDEKLYWNSHISSTNLKSEFTWFIMPEIKTFFGVNIGGYFFNPGNYSSSELSANNQVSKVNSGEVVLYAGNDHEITQWFKISYGMRLVNWSDYGEAFSVIYNEKYEPTGYNSYKKGEKYYSYTNLEPRISASFKTGSFSSVKLSYNITTQHVDLINNSISPFNSLEVWLPSGPNIKPQHAQIIDIGYMQTNTDQSIDFYADVFYKRMYNQIGYTYHAEMILNPFIEGELRQGDGLAYGLEVMVKKTLGKLTGQLGYAYIRSFLKIDGLNMGRAYPALQDKPLDFSLNLAYAINPRWNINSALTVSSGMRITTPTGFYEYRGSQVPIYTRQNNQSLPTYKRFDIGTTIRLNPIGRKTGHYLTIAFYNFFAAQNPAFLNFNKTLNTSGEIIVPADNLNSPELVPTYRYIYSIVPSFNYNFRF